MPAASWWPMWSPRPSVPTPPGPFFTVILLTLTFAVAIGASPVFLVQAAVSALYLVVVAPPTQASVPLRFVDALVGGAVALVVSQLAAGRGPVAPLVGQSGQVFDEL